MWVRRFDGPDNEPFTLFKSMSSVVYSDRFSSTRDGKAAKRSPDEEKLYKEIMMKRERRMYEVFSTLSAMTIELDTLMARLPPGTVPPSDDFDDRIQRIQTLLTEHDAPDASEYKCLCQMFANFTSRFFHPPFDWPTFEARAEDA